MVLPNIAESLPDSTEIKPFIVTLNDLDGLNSLKYRYYSLNSVYKFFSTGV